MSEYLILIYDAEATYADATPELCWEVMPAHEQFAEHVVERGAKTLVH